MKPTLFELAQLPKIDSSAIQWTGTTWNPWQGCTKKSAGCKNCYMYRDKKRYGQDPTKCVRSAPATFNKPLKWQREVEAGKRTGQDCLVFTCSWSDFFNEEADPWRDEAWAIIRACPGLQFQILTKLPERINEHLPVFWPEIRDRCWMGTSVEDQPNANRRIDELIKVDARTLFLSCEPLLGPVELSEFTLHLARSWVICGGESGPDARPFDLDWARSIRGQCASAGVPFFFKQAGSNVVGHRFRDSHGGDMNEWPADLRVRQFPGVTP